MLPLNARSKAIGYYDLRFNKVDVTLYLPDGTQYTKRVDTGMPKIPSHVIDTVFYLYRSIEDAKSGSKYGGTGFLVGVPSEKFPDYYSVYGVTNWHVALDDGYSVIRLNTAGGDTGIFDLGPDEWEFLPGKDDIAVSPILPFQSTFQLPGFIPISGFATEEIISQNAIGVGDDVFMVGRFIDYDGGVTNLPTVRFGNISLMPAPIEQPTGYMGKSYCIDLHSRSGYSGSPVLVYRTLGGNLEEIQRTRKPFSSILTFLYLLGIHWGQFPERWPLIPGEELQESSGLITKGGYVEGLSGMTCVIPAQQILELLNIPTIKNKRLENEEELLRHFEEKGYPPMPESVSKQIIPDTENPQHKEDFNSLVGAAVKTKLQDD